MCDLRPVAVPTSAAAAATHDADLVQSLPPSTSDSLPRPVTGTSHKQQPLTTPEMHGKVKMPGDTLQGRVALL